MEISLKSMKMWKMCEQSCETQTLPREGVACSTARRATRRSSRPLQIRAWLTALLVPGLLLAASSSQALSVDLSGVPTGTTNLDVEGFSLTVRSRDYRFVPLQALSITFDDGPVSLNSVDVFFGNGHGVVLANLMGDISIVTAREPGVVSIDAGGVQGTRIATLTFGYDVQIQKIDFDIVVVGGVDGQPTTPTSPIPEPGAALLFSAGMALIAIRQRANPQSSSMAASAAWENRSA